VHSSVSIHYLRHYIQQSEIVYIALSCWVCNATTSASPVFNVTVYSESSGAPLLTQSGVWLQCCALNTV